MNKDLQNLTGRLLLSLGGLVIIGTTFYKYVEGLDWLDSYYFTMITLSTVGYGDITPHTDIGKLFTTLYIVIGVGLFGYFINGIVSAGRERRASRREKNKKSTKK